MSSKIKWILWLKSVIGTIVVMLILLEVFIVSNEATKLLRYEAVRVSCSKGALNLNYGNSKLQVGPSVDDVLTGVNFVVNNLMEALPPFNFICLAKQVVDVVKN